jgi:hypothetical protein
MMKGLVDEYLCGVYLGLVSIRVGDVRLAAAVQDCALTKSEVSRKSCRYIQKTEHIGDSRRCEQHRCSEGHIYGEVDLMFETRRAQS